jgi:hypothetical protein
MKETVAWGAFPETNLPEGSSKTATNLSGRQKNTYCSEKRQQIT